MKRTRVIAVTASKGGVGKTTISAALAVRAAQESDRVALIDTDPQATLQYWWRDRGGPRNPRWLEVSCSHEGIELLIAKGWEWVIIDTPPALTGVISDAVACADLALIPATSSKIVLDALGPVEDICNEMGKPFAFVLNMVETGDRMTSGTANYLRSRGKLLDAMLSHRRVYRSAMGVGKSAPEIERGSASATEIDALWRELKTMMGAA